LSGNRVYADDLVDLPDSVAAAEHVREPADHSCGGVMPGRRQRANLVRATLRGDKDRISRSIGRGQTTEQKYAAPANARSRRIL
jgi:hypothetical protein